MSWLWRHSWTAPIAILCHSNFTTLPHDIKTATILITKDEQVYDFSKGQLISKGLFGGLNSSKNERKQFELRHHSSKSNCFIGSFEESKSFRNQLTFRELAHYLGNLSNKDIFLFCTILEVFLHLWKIVWLLISTFFWKVS